MMGFVLACNGKDCPKRMSCVLYDNYIYNTMKCVEDGCGVTYINPEYDSNIDYCENFGLEEA